MEKSEFRVLMKHRFLMRNNTVQAKQWLDRCYGDSALGQSLIIYWYSHFKCGRTDTNDAERSGRPNNAVTLENVQKSYRNVGKALD